MAKKFLNKTRLQSEREKRQLTQEEVANRVGVAPNTLSRWERGIQLPGLFQQRKLTEIFGTKVDNSWFRLESSEELFLSAWYVPYQRNPYFTDHQRRVSCLRERMTSQEEGSSRQSISGLGGIGKTQLALEYAYRYRDDYTAVLWVGAGSQAQLLGALTNIANLLCPSERKRSKSEYAYRVNEVLHWLQTHSGWLLILDNVEEDFDLDEEDSHNKEKSLTVDQLLSMLTEGHILLTTRAQSVANLVPNLLLEEMQLEEGAHLLLRRVGLLPSSGTLQTGDISDHQKALNLSQLLGGLPLALELAGAYIQETGCGLLGYRLVYEESRKDLLRWKSTYQRLYTRYDESVATTWLISFRHVEKQFAIASNLLKLCAYLAPDAIPENILLTGAGQLDSDLHQLAGNRFQFDYACQVLLNYSLIKRAPEQALFSIHCLIQAVLQDSMDEGIKRFWVEEAVKAVEHAFSSAEEKDAGYYTPHAYICSKFIKKLELSSEVVVHLLELAANTVYERGWYDQARPLYLRACNAAIILWGNNDPHVLHLHHFVLQVHMALGAYPFAALLYQKVKEDIERIQGSDHPDVIVCLNNLALAQLKMEDFSEAAQTCQQAFAWHKHVQAPDPAMQATTYHIAAEIHTRLGQVHRARAYYQAALRLREQVFGQEHPAVANSLTALGALYLLCQQLIDAEALLQRALEIQRKTLSDDHPDAVRCIMFLAIISWDQQNYLLAEERYQQALAICRQKLGPYHPDLISLLHDLAVICAEQKKNEEAEHYFREAFALFPHAGGKETYEYFTFLNAYICFLQEKGQVKEAEVYIQERGNLRRRLKWRGPIHEMAFSNESDGGNPLFAAHMWSFKRFDRDTP